MRTSVHASAADQARRDREADDLEKTLLVMQVAWILAVVVLGILTILGAA